MPMISRFVSALGQPTASNALCAPEAPEPDLPLTIARFQHRDAEIALGGDEACIVLQLHGEAHVERVCNGVRTQRACGPGVVTVVDPHDKYDFVLRGRADILHLHLPMKEFAKPFGPDAHVGVKTRFNEVDRNIERCALEALVALYGADRNDKLLLSSIAFRLSSCIAEPRTEIRTRASGGLSKRQLRTTTELIVAMGEAPIAASPNLSDLAQHAGLSVFHFAREFRRTVGCTPYAYTLRLRLERARDLVTRSNVAMAEIAQQTGFCSAAHFSDRFRREMGFTPVSLRRAVCN